MRPCKCKMHFGFGELYPASLAHLTHDGRHKGQDFLAVKGTPIIACVDGVLCDKGYRGAFGYSIWIKFWTDRWNPFKRRTYRLILAHLSEVLAPQKIGEKIGKTEIVALSGASGSATLYNPTTEKHEEHPHLHLEAQELVKGAWLPVDPHFVTGC